MSVLRILITRPATLSTLRNQKHIEFFTLKSKFQTKRGSAKVFHTSGKLSIRSNTLIQSTINGKYTATEVDIFSIVPRADLMAIGVRIPVRFTLENLQEEFVIMDSTVFGYIELYRRFSTKLKDTKLVEKFENYMATQDAKFAFGQDYAEISRVPSKFNKNVKGYLSSLFSVMERYKIAKINAHIDDVNVENTKANPTGSTVMFSLEAVSTVFTTPGFAVDERYYVTLMGLILGFAVGFRPQDACEEWAHVLKKSIVESYAEGKAEDFMYRLQDLEKAFRMHLGRIYSNPDSAARFRQHRCAFGDSKCIINTAMEVLEKFIGTLPWKLEQILMPNLSTYPLNLEEPSISLRSLADFHCERRHGPSPSRATFVLKILEVMRNVVTIIQSKYYVASDRCNIRGANMTIYNYNANVEDDFIGQVLTEEPKMVDILIAMYIPRVVPALALGTVMSLPELRRSMTNYQDSCREYTATEPTWIHRELA